MTNKVTPIRTCSCGKEITEIPEGWTMQDYDDKKYILWFTCPECGTSKIIRLEKPGTIK